MLERNQGFIVKNAIFISYILIYIHQCHLSNNFIKWLCDEKSFVTCQIFCIMYVKKIMDLFLCMSVIFLKIILWPENQELPVYVMHVIF